MSSKPGDLLPSGASKKEAVRQMFDRIAPRYELCNKVITLGMDGWWRRRAVRALGLAPGSTVLDLACGTGDLCRTLRHAGQRPVGVDLSANMLAHSHGEPALVRADASELPLASSSLDGAVCGFALRNFVSIEEVLAELSRVVRRGGAVSILEVSEPRSAVLRQGHRVWFQEVVPRLGSLLSDADAYRYLPRSVAYLPSPEKLVDMMQRAGFAQVRRRQLSGGVVQLLSARATA